MRAIETWYLGPTSHRGARIVATDGERRIIVSRHGENEMLNGEELHRAAAVKLCAEYGWDPKPLVAGGTRAGYVFVFPQTQYVSPKDKPVKAARGVVCHARR